jgi:hypothetical protein
MVRKAYAMGISLRNQQSTGAMGTVVGRAAGALHHRSNGVGTRIAA